MRPRARLSTRTLIRLARAGQVFCLLMSLSGVFLIAFGAPEPAAAQGKCASVCSGDDVGACIWCERWEHSGWGTMAAGSTLVLGGLLGATALGQLCHGLESGEAGGAGVSGDGDGDRRSEGGLPVGSASDLASIIAGLGLTNSDGTPVDPDALSSRIGQMIESGEEGRVAGAVPTEGAEAGEETGARASSDGEGRAEGGPPPPRGPASDTARDRWNLLNADGEGRVYGPGHQHILNIDADGNVTDLSGRPVQQVNQSDISTRIQTYVDADGNEIRIGADGQAWRTTDIGGEERFDLPTSPQARPNLSPEAALRWDMAGAGPNGELYAPDGHVIGHVDADGNMWAVDGTRISGHATPDAGRLQSFTTEDGQKWTWTEDGEYRPSALPEGTPFRPLSRQEWEQLDAQRAQQAAADQTRAGAGAEETRFTGETRVKGPGETRMHAGDETRVEGGEGRPTGAAPEETRITGETRVEGPDADTRLTTGDETRVEGGEGRPTSATGETQLHGGETRVEGPGETRVPAGAETRAEGGEARATGSEGDAEGAGARASGAGADAEGGAVRAAGTGAEGEGGAVRATGAAEGEAHPAGAEGEGGSLVGTGFSRAMDAQNIQQLYGQHIKEGKSPEEAFTLAVAQTGAGNLAGGTNPFGGVTDPRLSAAAGALLPGGMSNIIPDKAVENFVGTGYDALQAVSDSLGASVGSGQLDTTALDNFAEGVANRPNADPFAGYAQAAQLVGEETARTDGGNLVSDLQQIYDTGAGSEVLNESMADFQQQVEQGQFGAPLQGLNDLASAASEVIADPTTTVGQFVDDVRNIYNNGVGDGFWDEAAQNTANVIKNTPVAGTIYDGYHQVFSGIAEQGVTDFAGEMAEGAYALGQEAYNAAGDAVSNAASATYDYLRSWF